MGCAVRGGAPRLQCSDSAGSALTLLGRDGGAVRISPARRAGPCALPAHKGPRAPGARAWDGALLPTLQAESREE